MIASRLSLRFRKSYHPIRPTYLHHHHQHQHYHHGRRHRSVVGEEAEAAAAGATAVVAVEEEPSPSKPTPVPERWTGFYRAGPNISFIRPHCDLSVSPRSPGDVFLPSWRRQPALLSFVRSYSLRVAKVKKAAFDDEASYGYSKERFVWSLISAVGIFCLGSGATVVHGVQNLWSAAPPENMQYAALVIGGSFLIEGASLLVAVNAVRKCAAAEGMKVRDYIWRGHDPTSVAVMTEDGAAVTGLAIAAASLIAVKITGNAMYDPIGSIIVGNLLGMVAIFLIQRNRHALIGRAIDDHDMKKVLEFLRSDPVVHSLYDCKSEVIGPGFFRFKAEIDFNGVAVVQNYLERAGREEWASKFREAASNKEDAALLKTMACYGEELVEALGSEVDRLETEIQKIVPGIRHVDIEAHDPTSTSP